MELNHRLRSDVDAPVILAKPSLVTLKKISQKFKFKISKKVRQQNPFTIYIGIFPVSQHTVKCVMTYKRKSSAYQSGYQVCNAPVIYDLPVFPRLQRALLPFAGPPNTRDPARV